MRVANTHSRPATVLLVVVAACFCASSWGWAAAAPKAVVPAPSYDFGTVKQGEKTTHCFELRNEGSAALKIEKMQLTYPNMTARGPASIAPGKSGKVCVDLRTENLDLRIKTRAVLFVNDPEQPQVPLVLTGDVKAPVDLRPAAAVLVSVWKGDDAERTVTIVNNLPKPLDVHGLDVEGRDFKARVETQMPGKIYKVIVTIPRELAPGHYTGRVYVNTDSPGFARILIPVNILVKNEIYSFPPRLNFGSIKLAQINSNPASIADLAEWILVKKKIGKFKIKSISSDIPGLQLSQSPEGASNTFRITAALLGDRLQSGRLAGNVHVVTDDAVVPELTIPVTADIR